MTMQCSAMFDHPHPVQNRMVFSLGSNVLLKGFCSHHPSVPCSVLPS